MPGVDRVLIAGAGPVGLSCALFLTRSGIPVSVFEAESELSEDMRASTFHPATLDVLDDSHVVGELLEHGSFAESGNIAITRMEIAPFLTLMSYGTGCLTPSGCNVSNFT